MPYKANATLVTDEDFKNYILEHFEYCDGEIIRHDRRNSTGGYDKDGYRVVKVKKRLFKVHRIVWLLNYGEFPDGEIDHINRIRDDNRIENLRVATRQMQIQNTTRKPNPDTHVIGIARDKTHGLLAVYVFNHKGKKYRFRTLEDAIAQRAKLTGEVLVCDND